MVEEVRTNGTPSPQKPRKHGFYSSALSGELLVYYEEALASDGLEEEIGMLRAMIKFMIINNPFNVTFMLRAFNCLKGLITTQKTVFKPDQKVSKLERAFHNVYGDEVMPRKGPAPA